MKNFCLREWNWIRRFRHRKGYGVHSPSDFFLITFVIYEQLPFYAYSELARIRKEFLHLPHYREKTDRLMFRLVNYLQPSDIVEVGTGSGLSATYMAAAKRVSLCTVDEGNRRPEVVELLRRYPHVDYRAGDTLSFLRGMQAKNRCPELVHIADTPYFRETFEALLPQAGERTCFVVGRPYATHDKRMWWKQVVADGRTGVTFDLYDIGLVFFDRKRVKEHRIVNYL